MELELFGVDMNQKRFELVKAELLRRIRKSIKEHEEGRKRFEKYFDFSKYDEHYFEDLEKMV